MFSFLAKLFQKKPAPPRLVLPTHTDAVEPVAPAKSADAKKTSKKDKRRVEAFSRAEEVKVAPVKPQTQVHSAALARPAGADASPAPAAATPVSAVPATPAPAAPQKSKDDPKSPKAKEAWAQAAAKRLDPTASPESLAGINENMKRDEIANRLALLYRRHNRAASSLDGALREEAEMMLDIIAGLREKYLS
jgi:hypothetical protein